MAKAVGSVPTQADKRRNMTITDQHNRKWFAVIEKETGYPTGRVLPMFDVPDHRLYPDQKYMTFPEDQPGKLIIDYAAWEADQAEREREWNDEYLQIVNTIPGGKDNPIVPRLAGPSPMGPIPVRAMRQGNRWALGFTDKKPPEALHWFPTVVKVADESVFTETEPAVFTEEAVSPQATSDLAAILADIDRRCPTNLKGAARNNWAMQELQKITQQQPAGV